LQSLTRPDGSLTAYQYDVLNRLTQMTTTLAGALVSQYAYTYNAQDLRDGEAAFEPVPPYAAQSVNYTYNNVNGLTKLSEPMDRPLAYDADGNLVQGYTPQGRAFTAAYDARNHLTSLSYTDGGGVVNQTQYTYSGDRLINKQTYRNGALTREQRYTYDGFLPLQERDGNNNLVNEYTYGQGQPGGIGGLLNLQQGGPAGPQYSYLYDGKGNATGLLDGVGNVAQSYQYDPFGVTQAATGSVNQPVRFSTKSYDDQTGLSYYGYRFYAPALGRWLTRDPIGEKGGINLYAFVRNNPINFIDPSGLKCKKDCEDEYEKCKKENGDFEDACFKIGKEFCHFSFGDDNLMENTCFIYAVWTCELQTKHMDYICKAQYFNCIAVF
jgi:RHS repeat-associated protein